MSLGLLRDGGRGAGDSELGEARLGVGASVASRYRLEAVLGRGGAATVWRAHDAVLDRVVALKTLSPHALRRGEVTYERFLREARICAAIKHPNVVGLLDFGADHERPFLVMELLEGEPLDAKLEREVQLSVGEAIELATGILDGLAAAHDAGVVHRDLKPANVFLAQEGDVVRPKLLDFGISRSLDSALRRSAYTTAEGQLLGTPEYMSPEQARGSRDLDFRTDLYSAAVILYEMLAGILPYEADGLGDLIVEIVTREPPPLSAIRPDVGPISDVLARAMKHRRDARFSSAPEMRDALLAARDALRINPCARKIKRRDPSDPTLRDVRPPWEETTIVRPIAPTRAPATARRTSAPRRRSAAGIVILAMVCVAMGVLAAWWTRGEERRASASDVIVSGPRVAVPEAREREPVAPRPVTPRVQIQRERGVPREAPPRRARRHRRRTEPRRPAPIDGIIRDLDY